MPVIIDTGPLLAYLHKGDPFHDKANAMVEEIWDGKHGKPLSIDHVLEEGLTFLRSRVKNQAMSKHFSDLFWGPPPRPFDWVCTDETLLKEATRLHLVHYDRLSMTDSIVLAHARRLGAKVATFDSGFNGLIPLV